MPALRVTAKDPLTVRGLHFHAGEQVVVTVFHGKSRIRRLKATTTGVFIARFPSIEIGECDAYGLRAIGSKGSFASFKTPRYMCGAQPEAGG